MGRLRRQAITPPEGGISLGGWPLRPEEISSTEAHPAEPPRVAGTSVYLSLPPTRHDLTHGQKPEGRLKVSRKSAGTSESRGPLYLSLHPTNARIWHKAVFKVGPFAGPKPTRVRQGQKYLRPRRHSPFWGASGARQYPPRRELKPGGMAPWGRRKSPVPRHTRQNRPEVRRPTECNPRTGEERPHTNALERPWGHYLSLPPTRQDLTQVQKPEGRLKWG